MTNLLYYKRGRVIILVLAFISIFLNVSAQISVSPVPATNCKDADGKVTISVPNADPGFDLEFSIGGAFNATGVFEKLKAGNYTATVRDKNTQCSFTKDFTIESASNNLIVNISGTGPSTVCEGEAVTLTATASGGSGNFDFSWPGGSKEVRSSGPQSVTVTDKTTGCTKTTSGDVIIVPVVCSRDPNDIIGPEGYGPGKMIAKSKTHSYMVRFENDPDFATAPAQVVKINHPLDSNVNLFSLRLGDFGFGGMTFSVPPDKTFYTTRLNVMDSLGVVVDVTAGIDATKKEAFWIFESKDPTTGLPPTNALLGFLPVNDSTAKGEGFVTYTVRAANRTQTGDSIHAKASIVFDINAAIETPVVFNTIDAVAPVSQVKPLPAINDSTTIRIRIAGQDDPGGSGIRDYTLYVSQDGGVFAAAQSGITDTVVSFTGVRGSRYGFFTQAADNVGNLEALKNAAEATTQIPATCSDEICNGVDDDCDGQIDEGFETTWYRDADGDGFGAKADSLRGVTCRQPQGYVADSTDCNDGDSTVHPGAIEYCDGIDNDCDGVVDNNVQILTWYRDADGDGFGSAVDSVRNCNRPEGYVTNKQDCNDTTAAIHPGATEICDGLDNDCDGQVDEGFTQITYYRDADGDGYGGMQTITSCNPTAPAGYVTVQGDCNDNDNTVNPGATEICNGKDDDCDGDTDEGCNLITWYRDSDGDGYGDANNTLVAAEQPAGYVNRAGDCNDSNAAIHPGGTDGCNGIDDNCNGQIDENCGVQRYYMDVDNDGYGRNQGSRLLATPIAGWVLLNGDCADWDPTINPGAPELANGRDDNCNGQIDEGLPMVRYYMDVDRDGYGRDDNSKLSAIPLEGHVLIGGDCADFDATIYPGAPELANGRDDNCNGQIDEGLPMVRYYMDVDRDGYGRNENSKLSAIPLAGHVLVGGDCADFDATIYPGAPELANGHDDNCNGQVDEGLPMVRYYMDVDRDGYGRNENSKLSAIPLAGHVLVGGDCADFDATIYPGAPELANGRDDNCNGQVDEGLPMLRYYLDVDGDGYGRNQGSRLSAVPLTGYVLRGGDCADFDATIHPGAVEIRNGRDDNCNGQVDEQLITSTQDARTSNDKTQTDGAVGDLVVMVSPVPSYHEFVVSLPQGEPLEKVRIRIYDYVGRLIETRDNLSIGSNITIGGKYAKGYYTLEAVQGKNRKLVKLIKL